MIDSKNIKRRDFLTSALGVIGAVSTSVILPTSLSLAATPTDKRLIVILLRGGMDGLGLFPPFGDKNYQEMRGKLALSPPEKNNGMMDLDGFFGLHPSAASLIQFWQRQELAISPATATTYRGHSHLHAQRILENGSDTIDGASDGWLNRAVKIMVKNKVNDQNIKPIITVNTPQANSKTPFIIQGDIAINILELNQIPDNILGFNEKLRLIYKDDLMLAPILAQAIDKRKIIDKILTMDDINSAQSASNIENLSAMAKIAAANLIKDDGAKVAILDISGWDSHYQQGQESGTLARKIAALSSGIDVLYEEMHDIWDKTVIITVSEFGRSVISNDYGGTNNGTAGAMMILGGAVSGQKIIGKWPGLAKNNLYKSRDLMPTIDNRAIFKGILKNHMKISQKDIEESIFPNSKPITPIENLIR